VRILILGGAGMLGHRLFADLRRDHEVKITLRQDLGAYREYALFNPETSYRGVDLHDLDRLLEITRDYRPEVMINAVGIIKQLSVASQSIPSLELNSLLPHRLALIAANVGARLVHFSTDCVFSGRKGNYTEQDTPDAEDLYGRTKLLGEVSEPHCITLRTSFIGHELGRNASLADWFLAQRGTVRGFRHAIFSGFTTIEASRIVRMLVEKHPEAHGVWHVSSAPIDKYSLLGLIKKYYAVDTEIVPEDDFRIDRSLDSTRFRNAFGYQPPSWESMVAEMSQQRSVAK
jgi:dTDP-4-dehydrorhamnose reductase